MNALRLARLEFLRFRGPVRMLVPIALALVPLLYGSLYLWSNWNPYGRTDEIPVAVVIEDHPAVANGQLIDAGAQFAEQLRATGAFQWHFVDAQQAQHGLEHGRYYFTITVPPDFSDKLVSAENPVPQRASMGITLNDANNYIVGIVAEAAKSELQSQVNSAAHATYARAIYGDLGLVKQQLRVGAAGAHRLQDSTVLAQQGTSALTQSADAARNGSGQIADGVGQLARAGQQAQQAISAITDAGETALPSLTGAVDSATGAAAQTLSVVASGADLARQQTSQATADLQALAGAHPELRADPAFAKVLSDTGSLANTVSSASDSARSAHDSAAQAHRQAWQISAQADQLQRAVGSAVAPVQALVGAAQTVSGGAATVTGGLDALAAGSRTLQTAADQLHSGATDVTGVVDKAVQAIPDTSPQQTAAAADVLGSPVGIDMTNLHPAGVYGRGFAPFFFAIALWVMGLLAYLFLRPLNLRALAGRVSAVAVAVGGWLPVAVLGMVGGLVLYGVVQFGLGLDPLHPFWVAGLLILAAGCFVAIDHFLRTTFGAIGEALSLVLLIIQLTACGGLYPIETTPAPFRAVHPVLPMTYLVDGLRVSVSGGLTGNVVRDAVILAVFLVGFLAATTWTVHRQRVWTSSRLYPEIEA